jgi:hypothetical protein
VCLIIQTKLMKWNRVSEALHYRIEKASVSSVLHSEANSSLANNILTLHQCVYGFNVFILDITFKVFFKFWTLSSFLFKLSTSFRWDRTALISIGLLHLKSTSKEIVVTLKRKTSIPTIVSLLSERCWSIAAISIEFSVFAHFITILFNVYKNIWNHTKL